MECNARLYADGEYVLFDDLGEDWRGDDYRDVAVASVCCNVPVEVMGFLHMLKAAGYADGLLLAGGCLQAHREPTDFDFIIPLSKGLKGEGHHKVVEELADDYHMLGASKISCSEHDYLTDFITVVQFTVAGHEVDYIMVDVEFWQEQRPGAPLVDDIKGWIKARFPFSVQRLWMDPFTKETSDDYYRLDRIEYNPCADNWQKGVPKYKEYFPGAEWIVHFNGWNPNDCTGQCR